MTASSKLLQFIAKASVTLAVFWLILRGIDLEHWRAMLQTQDRAWLAWVVALAAVQVTLAAWRWRMILAAIAPDGKAGMTFLRAARIYYIGMFFSVCLPGTIGGDAVRVWLAKSDRLPMTRAVHSIIIDRLLGLLALCVLIALVLIPIGNMAGFNAVPLLLIAAAGGIAGLFMLFYVDKIMGKWKHKRFIAWVLYLAENLRLLFKRPGSSLALLAMALAGHITYCLCAYALAQSLGIALSPMQCIILIPPVPLAAAMPVSVGGWGIREAGIVLMLALAGVPKAAALMLSVQLGLAVIAVSLPGGLLWLAHKRHN